MFTVVTQQLTPEQLGALIAVMAGALISLAATYIPKFNTWFAALDSQWKPLVMLGFNVLGVGLIFGISCGGWTTWVICGKAGIDTLVLMLINMLVGNQVTFLLSPKPKSVTIAKGLSDIGDQAELNALKELQRIGIEPGPVKK